jgi:hypothetical protein
MIIGFVSACGGGGGSGGDSGAGPLQPSIDSFSAAQSTVTIGYSTELIALFRNGTGEVDNNVGAVVSGSPVSISPTETTIYTLTVTNSDGAFSTQQLEIRVVPAPAITSFQVEPSTITEGESANLLATFSDGVGTIDNGVGQVLSGETVTVSPGTDTRYTLSVTNEAGTTVTLTGSVTVLARPTIASFSAANPTVTFGESTTLTADFAGGAGQIDNGIGQVNSGQAVLVSPTENTVYTLTVANPNGVTATQTTTIAVVEPPPPIISSFDLTDTRISLGETAGLVPIFQGGVGSIDNGIGIVTSGNSVQVSPTISTTYTLTVTNSRGVSVSNQVSVEVFPPPTITSFTAGQSPITEGSSTTLIGIYENGSGSIDNAVGPVVSGESVTVSPAADTNYTLTVINEADSVTSQKVNIRVVQPASITSFESANASIKFGDSTTLTAVFDNGDASIDNGVGSATSGVPITVDPTESTTYTLTVVNEAGDAETSELTVQVIAGKFTLIQQSLAVGRSHGTATLLSNGQVLIPGGWNPDEIAVNELTATAEIYDPASQTFVQTGSMATIRFLHGSAPLPDGRAIVLGGVDENGTLLASAEIYDPNTGTFTPTGSMSGPRSYPTVKPLPDGRVLVIGTGPGSTAIEAYDPQSGSFTILANLAISRSIPSATVLNSGLVLIAGGSNSTVAELFNPSTNTVSQTGSLNFVRGRPTATLLEDGRVLVAGGYNAGALSTAEIYDPSSGLFTRAEDMSTPRDFHTATRLPNGKVLLAGGTGPQSQSSAELFDPVTETFLPTGEMSFDRYEHTATLLPDNTVLIIGGYTTTGTSPQFRAEIYEQQPPP